jgi:hypothetical protein
LLDMMHTRLLARRLPSPFGAWEHARSPACARVGHQNKEPSAMRNRAPDRCQSASRRSFLKKGLAAGTWSDKAGAAVSPPLAPLTDPTNGLTFPDLNSPPFGGENFTTNLIMPEPCPFLSRRLPKCSIIRPTETRGAATGALSFLTAMGLFIGHSRQFFEFMRELAAEADAARREDD